MHQPIGQRGVGNAGRFPGRYADYIRRRALALAGEYDQRNADPRRGGERCYDLGQAETASHADDPIGGQFAITCNEGTPDCNSTPSSPS